MINEKNSSASASLVGSFVADYATLTIVLIET
jgi:hypothetical protein